MPKGIYDHSCRIKDLTGKRFNFLVAIKFLYRRGNSFFWLWQCDCGIKKIIIRNNVVRKNTKSCGCFKRKKQGLSRTRFHNIWHGINVRCENKNNYLYGGRGIKNEWKSFKDFQYDMYQSYLDHVNQSGEKNTSIDRINNNGNYCKENCRWATRKEQANNTRKNILLRFEGKEQNITQWAHFFDMNYNTIYRRLRHKWPIKRIFTKLDFRFKKD